jgi:alpha-amylase/alpha-mannosidase (GH57 family)
MAMKTLCVHGHFYQPPREDPLSGSIPDENGAQPFRNWNERIHAECYQSNAALGNFEKLSFDMGPTLLTWMESFDKTTYDSIINQEKQVYERFGVGNGMAQAYNHVILPLATKRDKVTQIKWGIADFEHRFGHAPMGMWLPETAVDMETLTYLADQKMKFTILAPWQVSGHENLSTEQPYLVELPGGREPMIVFLYDRNLSTAVSFQNEATRNAEYFADNWLLQSYKSSPDDADHIKLIASDGELYGHHKVFRDKFLSHLLNGALRQRNLETTFPALWLLDHKPDKHVKINEYTSWSCHHGITRWMGECACTPGANWKAPLRWGLEKLAEALDHQYQVLIRKYTRRKWQLRNAYIHVFLGEIELKDLLNQFTEKSLTDEEVSRIGKLLAAQYERQRMFTSCGWFYNSLDRIEPRNNIAYAAQAVWLTKQATGIDLQPKALALLSQVIDHSCGLHGDCIFAERYARAEAYANENSAYFNPSSSLLT